MNTAEKSTKLFIGSAGVILLAAAMGRFLVASGDAPILALPDPALGIPLRYSVLITGAIELTVAIICLFSKRIHFQTGWLAWFATNYLVFKIGLFWMHCHSQATCIGSLTDPLRLSRGMTGIVDSALPFYLLFGGYASVFILWLAEPGQLEASKFVKMSCAGCGGHITFATQNLGESVACPHCQISIVLQPSTNLKMSCVLCNGHIEFPSDALGQRILCPHCAKAITLLGPA